MALSEQEIGRIDALLRALGDAAQPRTLAIALERLVPGVALRQCDASDVLEDPFLTAGSCDLHLLDTASHCIRLTSDPAEANGLLLAGKAAHLEEPA